VLFLLGGGVIKGEW